MEMAPHEKEQDMQPIEQTTKRYIPIDADDAISLWNLPVILSFGLSSAASRWCRLTASRDGMD
jgi:hypothetical protein